jgi:hypothetical protein
MGLSTLYEHAAASFSSLSLTYKILSAVLVIVVLNVAFGGRGKGYKNLPAYAPIELAIASYILSGDGIGRRIL